MHLNKRVICNNGQVLYILKGVFVCVLRRIHVKYFIHINFMHVSYIFVSPLVAKLHFIVRSLS